MSGNLGHASENFRNEYIAMVNFFEKYLFLTFTAILPLTNFFGHLCNKFLKVNAGKINRK